MYKGQRIIRLVGIILVGLGAVPMVAQEEDVPVSAGTDFYFTLFDHWGWDGQGTPHYYTCFVTFCSLEAGYHTNSVSIGSTYDGLLFEDYCNSSYLDHTQDAILKGVHIQTTSNCYLTIGIGHRNWTSFAETMILPKHLLGTQYMLQGIRGSLITDEANTPTATYSQFTIVGTENGTSVSVTPLVDMICVSTQQTIPPRETATYTIDENQVLLFQPADYTKDISGTLVASDKVVAVFQGNNLARIPHDSGQADYVWEQARPTQNCGKEFIILQSSTVCSGEVQVMALEEGTELYEHNQGTKTHITTMGAGQTYHRTTFSKQPLHFETSRPSCCYLYSSGCTDNESKSHPSMAEIVPIDKMSSDSRWSGPCILMATTRIENERHVKLNQQSLRDIFMENNILRMEKDGYVTYEIPVSGSITSKGNHIEAEQGGFSAYIISPDTMTEGSSACNISLFPDQKPEELCMENGLLFREDFGGNSPEDPEVSSAGVPSISNIYQNGYSEFQQSGHISTFDYLKTKKGQGNDHWHAQDDHTYPNDYTRGYFLEVDAYGNTIYQKTITGITSGSTLSFSAYVVNMHDACVIPGIQNLYGYTYPRLKFIIKDAATGKELTSYATGDIIPDTTKTCPGSLEEQEEWQLVGMKYTVPEGVESIHMLIDNDAAGYEGNDFGLDDIEIHVCYHDPQIMQRDTIVCDTIPFIEWQNKEYPVVPVLRDTVQDSYGLDSIYHFLNVEIAHCCPEYIAMVYDTAMCDTLLPFTWIVGERTIVFDNAETKEIEIQHPKWEGCADTIYSYTLDTFHCERLYPIIVNKYNWQLLLDYVALRRLFPEQTATAFQWYKDEAAISGATDDDYAEENELHGRFQLCVQMSDGLYVWSNILDITDTPAPLPVTKRIYNAQGMPVGEGQMTHGVYLIHYRQGEKTWTEKKIVH